MYSLNLDEVQNQFGNLGKPLSSMNLDELLKNVWTADANQSLSVEIEDKTLTTQTGLHRQGSISLTGALSKKTVGEVWQDIQQSKSNDIKKSRDRQPTFGEMTLEDFLVKAGVVDGVSLDKKVSGSVMEVDPNVGPQFSQQGQWMQYPQSKCYSAGNSCRCQCGNGYSFSDNQMTLPSPLMGALSDTQTPGRKRGFPEDMIVKTVGKRETGNLLHVREQGSRLE